MMMDPLLAKPLLAFAIGLALITLGVILDVPLKLLDRFTRH